MVAMTTLYIVSTPIGNLEDITLRALRILGEVDVVLCEDTRVTAKLLNHYEISARTMSYNAHASEGKVDTIFDMLRDGKNIALVSDAGTPTISDPGVRLVQTVRDTFSDDEVSVVTIPGPSALVAALSTSGITSKEFIFLGFLPHKKGRQTLFEEVKDAERTVVFYESSHRIMKALASLSERLVGEEQEGRIVVVARELTKIYEQSVRGTAQEVQAYFESHPDKVRGEFVVIVSGKK